MAEEKVGKRGVNLRPSDWEKLRRLAFHKGTTVSAQVRLAVDEYLDRQVKGRQGIKRAARRGPA